MLIEALIKIICVIAVMLLMVAYMILLERKIAAWIQDRIGPNRSGPRGILQPFCDGLKLLFKEDFTPAGVNKILFIVSPCVSMGLAVAAIAVIPLAGQVEMFGRTIDLQIAKVDIGILYIMALGSLGVYGVFLGGWASYNKYSFLGGLRSAAQMLSYEVPMALCVLNIILLSGTLRLEDIVNRQIAGGLFGWNVFSQPVIYVIFLACIFAETKRAPFDLPECEQELVGGYHTEYSSMKFGLYFLGEYAHIIVASSLAVVLFFGGWHLPGVTTDAPTGSAALVRGLVFFLKVCAFIFFFMWVRWTLPRFRFDQIMRLAWRAGVPLTLTLLLLNSVIMYVIPEDGAASRIMQLLCNIALTLIVLLILGYSQPKDAAENVPIVFEKSD